MQPGSARQDRQRFVPALHAGVGAGGQRCGRQQARCKGQVRAMSLVDEQAGAARVNSLSHLRQVGTAAVIIRRGQQNGAAAGMKRQPADHVGSRGLGKQGKGG